MGRGSGNNNRRGRGGVRGLSAGGQSVGSGRVRSEKGTAMPGALQCQKEKRMNHKPRSAVCEMLAAEARRPGSLLLSEQRLVTNSACS